MVRLGVNNGERIKRENCHLRLKWSLEEGRARNQGKPQIYERIAMELKDPVYQGGYARIPNGEYRAKFIRVEDYDFYGKPKRALWFVIQGGSEDGTELFFSCNIRDDIRKHSNYFKFWTKASYGKPPVTGECLTTSVFEGKVFKVRVREVTVDKHKQPLSPDDIYSVIDDIVEIVEPKAKEKASRKK